MRSIVSELELSCKLMTFEDFKEVYSKENWFITKGFNTNQRYGQWLYNSLYFIKPGLANFINGTCYDPFNNEENIPGFLEFVEHNWDSD